VPLSAGEGKLCRGIRFHWRGLWSKPSAMSESRPVAPIHVIGGGLAGSEAAWQIARQNVPVVLHEMRPSRKTPAHQTGDLAELVCSNSFRADDPQTSAIGILHREKRCLDSLILAAADAHKLPAGLPLAPF
jgi:methylenetetrahydrofolate--tRNA-(uracil-5-)-methyltransferase